MSPEDAAQLRYLKRKGSQVPNPKSQILRLVRKQRRPRPGIQYLRTTKIPKSVATTATNVPRFLHYDE